MGYEEAVKAASSRVLELIEDGFVIGLGSGRAVAQATIMLKEKIDRENLNLTFVPSSYQVEFLSRQLGLKLKHMDGGRPLDVTLDGADQVELRTLNMIKGGGGALAREKVIDINSRKVAIIISEDKLVRKLGEVGPVPVEVLPFAVDVVMHTAMRMGGRPTLRHGAGKVGPVITDNGNMILDVDFGSIDDPSALERKIRMVPGVVEVGLFIGIADLVYVGRTDGTVDVLRRE
ncbi:ribose 5-phosphate isomerase A [Candidatus Bathyarchaeota archaeon]|nr:ribose 5-phosphate isomerase A [Candidatus Bathyarchaeota archaeon]MBS7628378.1 ribose 5-phosphate isomerase A [Candidatus Bathyarchaeota archaeon]